MTEPIRVLIADDDGLVRAGLGLILAPLPDVEVVAEAVNGREAVDLTVRHRPRVALLDIQMPVMDGLAALREIRRTAPATAVIILTTFGEARYVSEALAVGAAGFLLKDSAADDLARAIRATAAGEAFLTPSITRQVLDRLPAATSPGVTAAAARLATLSDREREVLLLLAQGLSNAAISEQLWITEATVKTYVSRLFAKLECDNRVQAARLVHQSGLSQN
ncbi:response regulator [Actinoplanes derwentensis]|uniref:DNA-binding response regulator, NarL/FixJ family, contains REC and HTH domains n=1 Tax=Actinoplanes derwentensis TaxID=113562 RepID=A0A1H1YYK2_9ACTN|nr:response regulator transcription factor [Actinoplanes derwentensis]GID81349.1 DNA-binding response regulator [Actinoplanes derwentensis]SDT26544.1 DNA-binding response regulator, NarL/FixJ family, contains REC and HTH domains [Actinoplanes derwentensis]